MFKKLFFIVLIMNSFVFSSISYAGCSGTVCEAKIERLYISGNVVYIGTHGTETNLTNCVPISDVYIKLLENNPRFDEIYSLLLASQFSEKEVFIRTVNTASNIGDCEVQYVYVKS